MGENERDAGLAVAVLTAGDPWGRTIHLTEDRWLGHVLARHGELAPHLPAIAATLAAPEVVTYDRHHAGRECYYRADLLPAPLDRLSLKVVVRLQTMAPAVGFVITAYPVPLVTSGEVQRWP